MRMRGVRGRSLRCKKRSPELPRVGTKRRATYRPAQSRAMRAARAAATAALLAAASRALPLAGLEGKEEEAPTASAWLATDDAATDRPDEQGAAGFLSPLSMLQTGCAALCSPLKPREAPDARHSPNQAPRDTTPMFSSGCVRARWRWCQYRGAGVVRSSPSWI